MQDIQNLQLKDFEAFLFDLDGTTIEGSDRHFVECVRETGKEFGRDDVIIPPGSPLGRFVKTKFPEADEAFLSEFRARNKQRMLNTPRPVRFHEDTVAFINSYPHVPRALVTNCQDWEVKLTTNVLDLSSIFPVLVYNCPELLGKPAGDMYIHVAELLDTHPTKCLVFEDSPTGIQSGKNAGMTVVAIDRDTHRDFEGADYIVKSFLELR